MHAWQFREALAKRVFWFILVIGNWLLVIVGKATGFSSPLDGLLAIVVRFFIFAGSLSFGITV